MRLLIVLAAGCGLSVQGAPQAVDASTDDARMPADRSERERDASVAGPGTDAEPVCPPPSASTGTELTIARAAKPITIDGKLDEWACARFFQFDKSNAQMVVGSANVANAYAFAVAWDAQAIYVAAHVTDPDPREGSNQGDIIFKNDSVEVYLAASDDLRMAPYGDNDHQWVVDWANRARVFRNGNGSAPSAGFAAAQQTTGPTTYDVEIRIPATDTGRPAFAAAERLAFAFAASDSDSIGRQGTWMTWHRPNLACSADCCNAPCDKRYLERAVLAP